MLVLLRPSSEGLLRPRAPGARDLRGCYSHPHFCEQEGWSGCSPVEQLSLKRQRRGVGSPHLAVSRLTPALRLTLLPYQDAVRF
jgi:hypothetical protein